MLKTKAQYNKTGGVQYYHMIQSFEPGETTPELALEIAQAFAQRHLPGYEVVIGTHVDRRHIHSHILWNSVCAETGEDANDLGHFFLLMEHRGWEIRHGSRLGYRLRGQEQYMVP